jgi:hypothetical protein
MGIVAEPRALPSRPLRPDREFPRSKLWQRNRSASVSAASSKKFYSLDCGTTLLEGGNSVCESDASRSDSEQPKQSANSQQQHAHPAARRPANTAAARDAYIEALVTLRGGVSADLLILPICDNGLMPQWSLATDTAWGASADELQCSSVATVLADDALRCDQSTAALHKEHACELQLTLLQQSSLLSTATVAYGTTAAVSAAAEIDSDTDHSSSSGSGDERSVTLASDKQRSAKRALPTTAWLVQSRAEGKQSLHERYHRDVTPSYTRSSDAVLGRDKGINGSFIAGSPNHRFAPAPLVRRRPPLLQAAIDAVLAEPADTEPNDTAIETTASAGGAVKSGVFVIAVPMTAVVGAATAGAGVSASTAVNASAYRVPVAACMPAVLRPASSSTVSSSSSSGADNSSSSIDIRAKMPKYSNSNSKNNNSSNSNYSSRKSSAVLKHKLNSRRPCTATGSKHGEEPQWRVTAALNKVMQTV